MRALGFLLALTTSAPAASAAVFEGGLQLGVADRTLGNTTFRSGMNAQLYGDVMVVANLLAVGAYANGYPAGDRLANDRSIAGEVRVTTLGVRAKVFAPRVLRLRPYASVGAGYGEAEFPEVRWNDRVATAATKRFLEVPLTVGFAIPLEGPFVMTAEGSYRAAIGPENAAYDRVLHGSSSRHGHAWTLHFGLGIAL